MKKTLLLLSGGGMNCVYGAGFLYGLWEKGLPENLYIIAISGNAGNATYLTSKQINCVKEAWEKYLNEKKMINFLRFWKIFDIDYLVDYVFQRKFPINLDVLKKSKIKLYVPALNVKTKKIEYFCNNNNNNINWYQVLKAAKALPILYGKKIEIHGQKYSDSLVSSDYSSHINLIKKINPDEIIVLDNSNNSKKIIYKIIKNILFYKSEKINKENKKIFLNMFGDKSLIIKPEYSIGNLNSKTEDLKKYWKKGYVKGKEIGEKCFNKKIFLL